MALLRIAFVLGALAFSAAAVANDARPAAGIEKPAIRITVAPYGWLPTITGVSGLGPRQVATRVTPRDMIDGFKVGGMGYLRVDTPRAFAYSELIIADYDNPKFRPFFDQALKSKTRFVEVGIGLNRDILLADSDPIRVSPYIGVHYLRIRSFISGNLGSEEAFGTWTNPVAGITAELPVAKRLGLIVKADAAGFGLTDTDYRNVALLADYRFNGRLTLAAGYRWTAARFDNPTGLALDLKAKGPMVGLRYAITVKK